ncbi:MAG: type II toxin-antitoxin system VapC family toxin [Patulibacter sp.]
MAYFDTSAVVKLLVREPGADEAEAAWREARAHVSSVTLYAEARAAIAAAGRSGRVESAALRFAEAELERLIEMTELVHVDMPLSRTAGELADAHGLRGYDAVHLATALSVADPELTLVTWDGDLATAARACGLRVVPKADEEVQAL